MSNESPKTGYDWYFLQKWCAHVSPEVMDAEGVALMACITPRSSRLDHSQCPHSNVDSTGVADTVSLTGGWDEQETTLYDRQKWQKSGSTRTAEVNELSPTFYSLLTREFMCWWKQSNPIESRLKYIAKSTETKASRLRHFEQFQEPTTYSIAVVHNYSLSMLQSDIVMWNHPHLNTFDCSTFVQSEKHKSFKGFATCLLQKQETNDNSWCTFCMLCTPLE